MVPVVARTQPQANPQSLLLNLQWMSIEIEGKEGMCYVEQSLLLKKIGK